MSDSAGTARLSCRSGDLAGQSWTLTGETFIGRSDDCEVAIDDQHLSGKHARIYPGDDGWLIEDLDSLNGTRVDGTEIDEPVSLQGLHLIRLADAVDMVFVRSKGAAPKKVEETPEKKESEAPPPPSREEPARAEEKAPARSEPEREKPAARQDDREFRATMLDMSGFGALPDLGEEEEEAGEEAPPASEAEPPATPEPERAEPEKPAPREDDREFRATMLDMSGFGALPDLTEEEEEEAAEPEPAQPESTAPSPPDQPAAQQSASEAPAKEASPPEPPEKQAPAEDDREFRPTMLDMSGFGALPDLAEEEAATERGDDGPEGDAAAPRATTGEASTQQDLKSSRPPTPTYEIVTELDERGQTAFPLKPGSYVLGRSDEADIVIPDPEKVISRQHALIHVAEDGTVTLSDMGSANGTYVGDSTIDKATLEPGDTFKIGPYHQFKLRTQ